MTDFSLAEESAQLLRLTSNAYTLTVRQGPERGKAFAGPKEKDRKPVDPPPIIQLQIRDPTDPASPRNYLQSPYFFMCCNLCDADLSRPGQLAAAQQGDDIDQATQSALAGTLVSSLHRLKDIDNADGGFFVFPDVSVRIEGEFRLRFSLFEMLKTAPKVVFIKSVTTEPFTVYSPRAFPGMAESTFLSRSFGDQGVKLRIRKEPRILGKRSAPSEQGQAKGSQQLPASQGSFGGMEPHPQQGQARALSSPYRDTAAGYDEPPSKRHRTSMSLTGKSAYDQDQRSAQRSYVQQRDPYMQSAMRDMPPAPGDRGGQSAHATPSMQGSEYPFGHQRNLSSSTASSFISARGDYAGYNYPQPAQFYPQPRDSSFQYGYSPYSNTRGESQIPSVPPERQLPSSVPSQPSSNPPYPRTFDTQELSMGNTQFAGAYPSVRPVMQHSQSFPAGQPGGPQRSLPPPSQGAPAPLSSIGSTYAQYQLGNTPNTEGGTMMPFVGTQPQPGGQGHGPFTYRARGNG